MHSVSADYTLSISSMVQIFVVHISSSLMLLLFIWSSFTPKINLLGEYIENQLNMKHPELVQWFKVVELPHIAGFFAPSLKQWSVEYAGRFVRLIRCFMSLQFTFSS